MDVLDDLQAALDGRYEIERELGRGGMAVVYLARDLKHDRQVAIKVLPPDLVTSVGAERFLREIRTAAQLSHPNILPLHDSIAVDRVRCYVMPYVQGESLRQRLDRERQLGIEQAVDIARQVAAGLDYAHAHGIVHRDIKPENILLVGDQAMIADFGLALAVFTASSTPFTATGLAVGTPAYMSPEQAAADRSVDGRTDVYSLGCVFFEMIAGMPPFRGATAGALLNAHATRTPPSVCAERSSCPPGMDVAVQRALAKLPADRFRTAGEFAHALDASRASTPPSVPIVTPRRSWVPIAAVATVVAALLLTAPKVAERVQLSRIPLDSNRVVVLPADGSGGQRITASVARQRVMSALMEWRDLRVAEPPTGTRAGVDAAEASRIARRGGAARLLSMSVAPMGDSVEIRATLSDAGGEPVRQQAIRVADESRTGAGPYRQLAAALLRTSDGEDESDDARPGTTRVAAWRAFTRGDSLRRAWSLDGAEREFRHAVALDPAFARAHLWLAQVALWAHPDRDPTKAVAEAASRASGLSGLSARDSIHASALAALGAARYDVACRYFHLLHQLTPRSDAPWYGIAACLALDPVVVRDARSPSGWRFRSSAQGAVVALDSGIARSQGAPTFAFQMMGAVLATEPSKVKLGRGDVGDTTQFYAHPAWIGDSLVYLPIPVSGSTNAARERASRRTLSEALRRNIEHLNGAFTEWVRRDPQNPEAWASLAWMQEVGSAKATDDDGTPQAFRTLARARHLSRDPAQQLALAASQVRLLAKYSQFDAAHRMADSLLRTASGADDQQVRTLAGVAALIGDISRATSFLRSQARAEPRDVFRGRLVPPSAVTDQAVDFLVAAALGQCDQSLVAYPEAIRRLVLQFAPNDQRDELVAIVTTRAITLAVPCLGPGATRGLQGPDQLLRMQQTLARGDLRLLRLQLDSARDARLGGRPGDLTLDRAYQEAWLLNASGRAADAGRAMDLALGALPDATVRMLSDVPTAGALGRALMLGADLAFSRGDTILASCYAVGVLSLWKGASPALLPGLSRVRAMAGVRPPGSSSRCAPRR